jgi:hypothetical protein
MGWTSVFLKKELQQKRILLHPTSTQGSQPCIRSWALKSWQGTWCVDPGSCPTNKKFFNKALWYFLDQGEQVKANDRYFSQGDKVKFPKLAITSHLTAQGFLLGMRICDTAHHKKQGPTF